MGIDKQCTKCGQIKSAEEFCMNKRRKDGLSSYCKKCQNEYSRAHSAQYWESEHGKSVRQKYAQSLKCKEIYKRNRERRYEQMPLHWQARNAVGTAVRYGKILPPSFFPCIICGKKAQQYHHDSYDPSHWLVVAPICNKCHRHIHLESISINNDLFIDWNKKLNENI
jgi:hypothetical protein